MISELDIKNFFSFAEAKIKLTEQVKNYYAVISNLKTKIQYDS